MFTNEVMIKIAEESRRAFLSLFKDAHTLKYESLDIWEKTLVSLVISGY